MDSAKVFEGQEGPGQLWTITWDRISTFLPNMKEELFKERDDVALSDETTPTDAQPQPELNISVIQHNIENATRSSIILQPPSSEHNIASPLFAHLGQMVSTPIGAPTYTETYMPNTQASITSPPSNTQPTAPQYVPNLLVNTSSQGHTFPVLYNNTYADTQPVSLYSEYIGNPYNFEQTETVNTLVNDVSPTITQNDYASNSNPETEDSNSNPVIQSTCETTETNIFQSANYFCSTNESEFIPPGSEILFTPEQKSQINCNIPVVPNLNSTPF